jgi:hypothetical protein
MSGAGEGEPPKNVNNAASAAIETGVCGVICGLKNHLWPPIYLTFFLNLQHTANSASKSQFVQVNGEKSFLFYMAGVGFTCGVCGIGLTHYKPVL